MKRGEIYYIAHRNTIGAEIKKARPAIIVSNDHINTTSEVVEVVYLTTQPKNEMPSHVAIKSSGCEATALCEHIDHVSTLLIGDYCGTCTKEELAALDRALKWSLGMEMPNDVKQATELSKSEERLLTELGKVIAERDRYAKIFDILLEHHL